MQEHNLEEEKWKRKVKNTVACEYQRPSPQFLTSDPIGCRLVVLPSSSSLKGTVGEAWQGEGGIAKESSCRRSSMDLTMNSMLPIRRDQRRRGRRPGGSCSTGVSAGLIPLGSCKR